MHNSFIEIFFLSPSAIRSLPSLPDFYPSVVRPLPFLNPSAITTKVSVIRPYPPEGTALVKHSTFAHLVHVSDA
jgi:hypothetical protein